MTIFRVNTHTMDVTLFDNFDQLKNLDPSSLELNSDDFIFSETFLAPLEGEIVLGKD